MVHLRDVELGDLQIFFKQQLDPVANEMAAFPARSEAAFMEHWKTKVLGNKSTINKTIVKNGSIVGYVACWEQEGLRLVGYWVGKEYWGQGIATLALSEFLHQVKMRPLNAFVAKHNVGSVRVLEKCGFKLFSQSTIFSEVLGREIDELLMVLN